MLEKDKKIARAEIYKSMKICFFFTSTVGISFDDEKSSVSMKLFRNILFLVSTLVLASLVVGDMSSAVILLNSSGSLAEFIGGFHVTLYGAMSLVKLLRLQHKKDSIKLLLDELVELWPVNTEDEEAAEMKNKSLSALRRNQAIYAFWNELGDWLYNITPILIYWFHKTTDKPTELGFVWPMSYPFDKRKYHAYVYIFEVYAGFVSVSSMVSSDLIFTLVSHISMMLRILQIRIRKIGTTSALDTAGQNKKEDTYEEVVEIIKTHQKLIIYQNDLEDTFSMLNLINVMFSSVNICLVVFSIVLLEPWMEISNKFFLGATLTQVGIMCWYADDIYRTSVGISDAVYENGWYHLNPRCQRALLLLLTRAQKPLYFTALRFSSITLVTFTSILTNSYSYFTLLYTMYVPVDTK